jgi:ABC-type multidrug transport system permease subunit
MQILIIARAQLRLFLKNRVVILLFLCAPLFLIFLFGQAFSALFKLAGMGMSSTDYCGITFLSWAVLQGSSIAAWCAFKDRKLNTKLRLSLAPLDPLALVFGTFLGAWILIFAAGCLILALAALTLSVNYGPSLAAPILLLGALSFFSAALGLSIALLVGRERNATSLMGTLVPALVLLGGGYAPIPASGFLHEAARISPLRWINLAFFAERSGESDPYALVAILFCLIAAAVLLFLAGARARRPS